MILRHETLSTVAFMICLWNDQLSSLKLQHGDPHQYRAEPPILVPRPGLERWAVSKPWPRSRCIGPSISHNSAHCQGSNHVAHARLAAAWPLGVSWHFTLKASKGDRVVKTGVSLGPFKIMAVMTLGKHWSWRSVCKTTKPQAKLYGSAFFIKGSTAIR